jgi:hypothetical protein
VCREVGGALVRCVTCKLPKKPIGRDSADPGLCTVADCPGYMDEPRASELWPGEVYGEAHGHMGWHWTWAANHPGA